jgi:hypothetical protein
MPQPVSRPGDLKPSDLFDDCRYQPCLCTEVGGADDPLGVWGISLVDGTPCACCVRKSGLRKLTVEEAVRWKYHGPPDLESELANRWW